ncbi:acetate/propionate family kinase [Oceaniovalibus sp. ACAM 378]|uniref:acetate/propionate family kinase n=1 Tax=Oceaniovalibus sp. ACAM 378 TaxID=2599923 RepID=UPI0011D505EF|nr:acetate/propionate family kinase [Oceaniovalibus sp. ACAM 378]TYB85382.1 acetate/propionate family kinase [Oceaniovalibus sp. ACAM 378]
MNGVVLTLNAGSSSLKFAVFDSETASMTARISGKITGIGGEPFFAARDANGRALDKGLLETLDPSLDHEQLIALLFPWLEEHHGDRPLLAVGHRVVHGGQRFNEPTRISDEVLAALEAFVPLAPLHQPHNLAAIRAVSTWQPDLPQIACFDTSFHAGQRQLAKLFALPRALSNEGIIRYGFHGLSYEYIANILPDHLGELATGRVIVAHLGNGSSMCAIKNQQSVATSTGFTALDGLMMGRRCGNLDPGVVLYLMQVKGMTADAVTDLLYRQSGLLGVSGISNNMHVLQQSDDPHAREAVQLYCYRAASVLAGLIPAIGGLDALVFTAGIGENSTVVRAAICAQLEWLGIAIDPVSNDMNAVKISAAGSAVEVLVLPTNEEVVVASACRKLVA